MPRYTEHKTTTLSRHNRTVTADLQAALKWLLFTVGGTISAFLILPLYTAILLFPHPDPNRLALIKHPVMLILIGLSMLLSIWFCLFRIGQLLSDYSIVLPKKHLYAVGILLSTSLCILYLLCTRT